MHVNSTDRLFMKISNEFSRGDLGVARRTPQCMISLNVSKSRGLDTLKCHLVAALTLMMSRWRDSCRVQNLHGSLLPLS
jgi:hypothetical protein